MLRGELREKRKKKDVCVYIKREKRWKEFGEKKLKKKEKNSFRWRW
jgi:hypothetical protein